MSNIRKHFILAAAVAVSLLSGCAAQMENLSQKLDAGLASAHQDTFDRQTDKDLASAFYSLGEGRSKPELMRSELAAQGYELQAVNVEALHIKRRGIVRDGNFADASRKLFNTRKPMVDDPALQAYLRFAAARGSAVKLYRPALAQRVFGVFPAEHMLRPANNTQQWYGLDNVLVEYAPDGRVLSIAAKSYQGISNFGVAVDEYVHIWYGRGVAARFENQFGNNVLNDTFIRVQVSGQQPAQAAR